MIFNVAYLIWNLSQYTVLEPGDLINTGTPQGVALSGPVPVPGAPATWSKSRSTASAASATQ